MRSCAIKLVLTVIGTHPGSMLLRNDRRMICGEVRPTASAVTGIRRHRLRPRPHGAADER
jgi:hypothetical protein